MAMRRFYRVRPMEVEDINVRVELLYIKATGKVIIWVRGRLSIALGEQAKIDSGEWALKRGNLSPERLAELESNNIKINPDGTVAYIGKRNHLDVDPR